MMWTVLFIIVDGGVVVDRVLLDSTILEPIVCLGDGVLLQIGVIELCGKIEKSTIPSVSSLPWATSSR